MAEIGEMLTTAGGRGEESAVCATLLVKKALWSERRAPLEGGSGGDGSGGGEGVEGEVKGGAEEEGGGRVEALGEEEEVAA